MRRSTQEAQYMTEKRHQSGRNHQGCHLRKFARNGRHDSPITAQHNRLKKKDPHQNHTLKVQDVVNEKTLQVSEERENNVTRRQ